jgi:hypothetical protein
VTYLENSAHMPFQEEPERYAAAVLEFLGAEEAALDQQRQAFRSSRQGAKKG